ncbi:MAG: hypothetical protein PHT51_03195 [Patescibacteria group bacterium]|nr:hypothetical protein [Patescibacteria group bacterium]MDD4611119.1 hypothetical protein [Patescibacteria group bacterium]
MENIKPMDNKSEKCEKPACCKKHHIIMIALAVILFIAVFAAGLAIGNGFSHKRNSEWNMEQSRGGCMMNKGCARGGENCPGASLGNELKDTSEQPLNNENPLIPEENINATTSVTQ